VHGVGWEYVKNVVSNHIDRITVVPEQSLPDPKFSTVKYPNPEEEGALDLAYELAKRIKAQVIIANDPDADRLGLAEVTSGGQLDKFSGNEIALILTMWILEKMPQKDDCHKQRCVISSVVSSKMLKRISEVEGFFHFFETLTGFKYIGHMCLDKEQDGYDVILGFEEAIGFRLGTIVPDKDGISAASIMVLCIDDIYNNSPYKCLRNYVNSFYQKYGYFLHKSIGVRNSSSFSFLSVVKNLNNDLKHGLLVEAIHERSCKFGQVYLKNNDMTATINVRQSGTEPKVKVYVEVSGSWSQKSIVEEITEYLLQLFKARISL
jgi:phosphomannomutase